MIRFIAAAPKSGSSYIAGAVIMMQTDQFNVNANYRLYPDWWIHLSPSHDWDLRPNMEQVLVENYDPILGDGGAVYKGHFWANQKNISVLQAAEGSCLVILRSPIDTLAAQYCSMLAEPEEAKYNPIYPLNYKGDIEDVEAGIDYLINEGYLTHLIMFYSDWLYTAGLPDKHVILYEEFVENPAKVMAGLATEIEKPHDLGVLQRNMEMLTGFYTKKEIDPKIYPRGWTAGVDIWKNYYSDTNVKQFEQVWAGMMQGNPVRIALLDILYPDGRYEVFSQGVINEQD